MQEIRHILSEIRKNPNRFLIIHYSSQSLFDEVEGAFSPRITSIVIMFYDSRQTVNFSLHAIAEELEIPREDVEESYNRIEALLLERFFDFAQNHFDKIWLHWNMRNTIFGFEHLEHRFRVLKRDTPPTIPYDRRLNISDVFKKKYGPEFAPDPRMLKLMEMNGRRDPRFLTGSEEAAAFERKDFIRMKSSTISKVEFFRYALERASVGKLKSAGSSIFLKVDRLLDGTSARLLTFAAAIIGIPSSIITLLIFLYPFN